MKRILIVDGDMAVRAQIGRYARLEGYDVAEASDGYTAWRSSGRAHLIS